MRRRLGRFDRRRLLQFGAAGAGALALAPLLRPAAAQGRGPLGGALTEGFTAHPSLLAFGPVVDIAAGWDGTLWAIDAQGAPSVYDQVAQTWELHGTGIDAVAYAGVPGAAVADGVATPAAVAGGTVAPPPLAPATTAPTVAPPPLAPDAPAVVATTAAADPEGERVVRIALAAAPVQQGAPTPAAAEAPPAVGPPPLSPT
ncbi:MAG TPA: hypothetical protein VNK05_07785, partial [Chloroflexota bacterium]|nr:hypothetical protein [Chloroflexota bacterium]